MENLDTGEWIVNPDEFESQCEFIRTKTAYVYTYPFVKKVWETGCKVISRDGRTIKKIKEVSDGYIGILDGEELHWDKAGRFSGPYVDSPNDMRICERYFRKDWQAHIKMGNAEWTLKFGRTHPTKKM